MSENKNAKTPADGPVAWSCQCGRPYTVTCISSKPVKQEPDAWCNGMPAYDGPLSKEQRKPLVQDLDAPLTLNGVPLYTEPQKQWVGLTKREVELIDEMIETQLLHAERCDHMANSTMAQKQKAWDLERVELLRKLKEKNT